MSNKLTMVPRGIFGRLAAAHMEWAGEEAREAVLSALALRPGERLVEIGFGTGALLERAERGFAAVIAGVDASPLMVAQARRRLRGEVREGRASSLPWARGSFDAAVAMNAFQFINDPDLALAEVARVLRPGGRLVMHLHLHGRRAPDWLPNPLSRTGDEIGAAVEALQLAGFRIEPVPKRGPRGLILATRL